MGKGLSQLFVLLLFSVVAFSQARTITGTVTDQSGAPVPFASVRVQGTQRGTTANENGVFSIQASQGDVLQVSAVGITATTITVGATDNYTVTVEKSGTLNEVVVTALNIRRDKKSVPYSAQNVSGEKLNIARETNLATAIAGKIAGVQIVGTPSVGFRSPNIRIRGVNTLSGEGPLYILDGTPVDANAINMDNVENLTVLKGAAATALYGQRAAGGVVLITSKKGRKNTAPKVEINTAVTFERVGLLPKYQNEYAGGYSNDFIQFEFDPSRHPADWASFDGQNMIEYYADESWGPKMDGRMYRPYWSWFPGEDFGKEIPLSPQKNNVRDFFETGITTNNNVAVSGGGGNFVYRLTYNNQNRKTPVPNSGQNRNFLTAATSFDLNKWITINSNINYQTTSRSGNFLEGYGGGLTASFNQWFQRQIDMDRLANYKNPDGSFNSWNILGPNDYNPANPNGFLRPLYWDNPYYDVNENTPTLKSNRVYGDVGLTVNLHKNFSVTGTMRGDIYNDNFNSRITQGGLSIPRYAEGSNMNNEYNFEGIATYTNKFNDWDVEANVGGNILKIQQKAYNGNTVGGLSIPGFYSLVSSRDRPFARTLLTRLQRNSLFARTSIGWNQMLYIELSGRNDWSSALPTGNNSYFYPSAGVSFILSELDAIRNIDAISFAKIRASVGQVGRDLDPYNINNYFQAGNAFGTSATLFTPNVQPNPNLKPNLQTSYEGGLEMRFLNNRLGFDIAYYKNINTDQILAIQVPQSSGVTSSFINAGRIESQGFEALIEATPVKTKNFNWDITLNFARNRSKVIELEEGLDNYVIGNATTFRKSIQLQARVGEEWGQIVGTTYRRDPKTGMPLLAANGNWLVDDNKVIRNALPDFTGGVQNFFRFGNVTLGVNIDFQKGGAFYSVTRMFNAYSGLGEETIGMNDKGNPMRDPVADGGGLRPDGILPDSSMNTDLYVDPQVYFGRLFDLHDRWVYDASFVKLREISLGYTFPEKTFGRSGIKGLSLSVIARNVALLYSNVDGIDPSELEVYWHEGGQLPATRSIGLNARITF
jgi:TonB-linked SusC/RagA family outer membrane protein